MNVGEWIRERDRLLAIIEEAKTARVKLKQINVLIALYGDDEKVDVNGSVPEPVGVYEGRVECDICGQAYKGKGGLAMHKNKAHGIASESASAVRQRNLARES